MRVELQLHTSVYTAEGFASVDLRRGRLNTDQLRHARFTSEVLQRSIIATVSLLVLLVFVAVELGFSYFHFPTPRAMLLVAATAILLRLAEIAIVSRGRRAMPAAESRRWAIASIALGLLLPFCLAAATQQFHSSYFGLLILPVLEAALYLPLSATLAVAAVASASDFLWVAYAAHFEPPFQLGELLEATTLVLLLFIVATLVWSLLDLLGRRERELARHVEELRETRTQLIEGEKLAAVGRLASSVAHEIRNPVAIISSAIEAAGSVAFSDEDREEMARVALAEARRLEKLTTDFLRYAQPGRALMAEVDAAALVGYIGSIARAQALAKGVQIELNAPESCLVRGNEDQLQQALVNLLRNAIDASPKGGRVAVEARLQQSVLRISVENGGPPIPDYAVPRLFEPFFTAKPGGTGLGLAIARQVAETHAGELLLERNLDGCVLFALLLPVFHPSSAAAARS